MPTFNFEWEMHENTTSIDQSSNRLGVLWILNGSRVNMKIIFKGTIEKKNPKEYVK